MPQQFDVDQMTMGDLIDEYHRGEDTRYRQFAQTMRKSVAGAMKNQGFEASGAQDIAMEALRLFFGYVERGVKEPHFQAKQFFWFFCVRKARETELREVLKRRKAGVNVVSLEGLEVESESPFPSSAPGTDFRFRVEREQIFEACFGELPLNIQRVLRWHHIEGWTQQEIARELQTTQATISRWQRKGESQLRTCLEKNEYDEDMPDEGDEVAS